MIFKTTASTRFRFFIPALSFAVLASSTSCAKEEKSYTVEYEVTGTAKSVDIVYTTDAINKETANSASLPWTKTITAKSETPIAMAIQNVSDNGIIEGRITVNGQEVKTCSSTGPDSIAECGAGLLE